MALFPAKGLSLFVYSSTALCTERSPEMAAILAEARRRNAAEGVTGFLHLEDGLFFQCVEGEAEALDRLYLGLRHDPRHEAISLLGAGPLARRRFTGWAMGFSTEGRLSLFDRIAASPAPQRPQASNAADVIEFLVHAAQGG